jgi:hypothetical protein
MKFTADSIRHGFGQVKSFFHSGYQRAHKFASGLDNFVDVSKRAYGVLAPLISELGGGALNRGAMKALGGYEDLKRRAIDVDTRGQQVVGRLRSVAPELQF